MHDDDVGAGVDLIVYPLDEPHGRAHAVGERFGVHLAERLIEGMVVLVDDD
jgi:hypothetical protein